MKVIKKKVGEDPVVLDVEVTYEFMNESVGGFIEVVPIGPNGVDVVCNEEGMFSGPGGGPLPQNAAGFLGDILIVGHDNESGDPRSLTDEEVRKGLAYLERFKDVKHPGDEGTSIIGGQPSIDLFMDAKARGILGVWASL